MLIQSGFLKGQAYMDLPAVERSTYAIGVLDGMELAPLLGAPSSRVAWVGQCSVGMTSPQVMAILDKHLREHPEEWHQSAHVALFRAMKAACPKPAGDN